jgi:hypothetical protein
MMWINVEPFTVPPISKYKIDLNHLRQLMRLLYIEVHGREYQLATTENP